MASTTSEIKVITNMKPVVGTAKKPTCGFCADALTEENISVDHRVCQLCYKYVTQSNCDGCGERYTDCACPCADCGERVDDCYCHYNAEPVEPWCSYCDCDPCECERRAAEEDKYDGVKHKSTPSWFHADNDESTLAQRCSCGVRLTGFEGWGAYCSRDCALGWAEHED
jgi:hypothetical protein